MPKGYLTSVSPYFSGPNNILSTYFEYFGLLRRWRRNPRAALAGHPSIFASIAEWFRASDSHPVDRGSNPAQGSLFFFQSKAFLAMDRLFLNHAYALHAFLILRLALLPLDPENKR